LCAQSGNVKYARISGYIVAERFKAGESADEFARDYGCEREKIEEAIRCERNLAEAA
jgi:uncharacterized protein (DUF433 family)